MEEQFQRCAPKDYHDTNVTHSEEGLSPGSNGPASPNLRPLSRYRGSRATIRPGKFEFGRRYTLKKTALALDECLSPSKRGEEFDVNSKKFSNSR